MLPAGTKILAAQTSSMRIALSLKSYPSQSSRVRAPAPHSKTHASVFASSAKRFGAMRT